MPEGDAYLGGGFDVGEGDYHVDWMMRDRMERVCSSNWDITAALTPRDQNMKLAIAPNAIEAVRSGVFQGRTAGRARQTRRGVQGEGAGQLRSAAGICIEHAAHRYQRAGIDPAQYLARAENLQIFRRGVQYERAARGLPAGRCRSDRFPGARKGAVVAEVRHDRLQKAERSAQRKRLSVETGSR